MRILFLAPQPFFQERGTPIAVRLALEVLSKRGHDQIDLVTYHEGSDVEIPNVTIHRIPAYPWLKNVPPGISFKKIVCDLLLCRCAFRLARAQRYDLVHAVEESAFIARALKRLRGIPYLYDMDSSLALQLTEKWWLLRPFFKIFEFFERDVVRRSDAVVPVCDALAVIAQRHGSRHTEILRDISLLDRSAVSNESKNLRKELGLSAEDLLILYIGNLESYQGVDLLLASFERAHAVEPRGKLIVIGGSPTDVQHYRGIVAAKSLQEAVFFVGPRPVTQLYEYLSQADILASPRVRGNNTPMKIYSYLHSGKPLLATELPTHTQVLDSSIAMLAAPTVESYGDALTRLLKDGELRDRLAQAAFACASERYTFAIFEKTLNRLYDSLAELGQASATSQTLDDAATSVQMNDTL